MCWQLNPHRGTDRHWVIIPTPKKGTDVAILLYLAIDSHESLGCCEVYIYRSNLAEND